MINRSGAAFLGALGGLIVGGLFFSTPDEICEVNAFKYTNTRNETRTVLRTNESGQHDAIYIEDFPGHYMELSRYLSSFERPYQKVAESALIKDLVGW